MTKEEFNAWDNPDKNSPYTLIRRNEDGSLKTVWYHDEYSENIEKIAVRLAAAADITIKPSVKNYLLKKIEALRTDNYYESDLAWLDMDDSKMDLVIGPNQTDDDQLYGKKTSYREFLGDIERAARAFTAAGIVRDDAVTICMPNTPQAIVCFYALSRIGAVANMIHPQSALNEITFYLNFSKSKCILTLDMFCEKVTQALN
jgi:fructose-specific component phosphotransferase system IIB-like protein